MAFISGAKCIKCKKFKTHWSNVKYRGRRICADCGHKLKKYYY